MLNLTEMESSTALPSHSSWPELSPSWVINPSRPLSKSAVHHSSPGSPNITPHVPTQGSHSSHQSLLLQGAGEFPNPAASLRDLSRDGCFSCFGNLQRCCFCTTVSIPLSPAKPIGSVGNGVDESMCHLLPGPSALEANAESHLHS